LIAYTKSKIPLAVSAEPLPELVEETPAVESVNPKGLPTPFPETKEVPSSFANCYANSVPISDSKLKAESSSIACEISTRPYIS